MFSLTVNSGKFVLGISEKGSSKFGGEDVMFTSDVKSSTHA
jgi:hypothetical protein